MNYTVVSSTSRYQDTFLTLPNKYILGKESKNFLVNKKKNIDMFIENEKKENHLFIADCERKQGFSIYDEFLKINLDVIDYKPNDLTMEATDLAILNYFNRNLEGMNIGIYGTGNIAFKLALRLSERNANVYLFGRNHSKVATCISALKQITFDENIIHFGDLKTKTKINCLVSFVTAENVINSDFVGVLGENSLCLDGGIGNFSKQFISLAISNGHEVRRVDVRQSQEIMDGYINSRINSKFTKIIGRDTIKNYPIVAGGIMGKNGEIIVDRIVNPSKVIGIANGIGGVKDESDLSAEEQFKIKEVQSAIEQDV